MTKQMKFYQPVRKNYYTLYSENAVKVAANNINYQFKWLIPSIFIRNGEIKLVNVSSLGASGQNRYIMRLNQPIIDNSFDGLYGAPILFNSYALNDDAFVDTPELRVHNKNINEIIITIDDSISALNTGLPVATSFAITLQITDYEPEETTYSYDVNTKQNYNNRII